MKTAEQPYLAHLHPDIGLPAIDVIRKIIDRNPTIEYLHFQAVRLPLAGRAAKKTEDDLDPHSEDYEHPRDDYLLSRTQISRPEYGLERLIIINCLYDPLRDLPKLFSHYRMRKLLPYVWGDNDDSSPVNPAAFVTINSNVILTNQQTRHIPMMDFRCPVNEENQELVAETLHSQAQRGWILDSGGSYHYLGYDLFTPEQWSHFLASNKDHPLVDRHFVTISEKYHRGSLRFTPRKECKFWRATQDPVREVFVDRYRPIKRILAARPAPRVVAVI